MNLLLVSHSLITITPLPLIVEFLQRAISSLESSIPPFLASLKDGDYSRQAPPGAETALVEVSVARAAKSCGCFSVHVSLASQQHWLQLPLPEVHRPPECSFPLGASGPMPAWLSHHLPSLSSIPFAGSSSFPWLVTTGAPRASS